MKYCTRDGKKTDLWLVVQTFERSGLFDLEILYRRLSTTTGFESLSTITMLIILKADKFLLLLTVL